MQTVDCLIECRFVAPVEPAGVHAEHALVVQSGRVLAFEPIGLARRKYAPRERIERPEHLLLPGFVNATTRLSEALLPRGPWTVRGERPELLAQLAPAATAYALGELVRGGVTTVADLGVFPRLAAATVIAHGVRLVLGLPLAARPSAFAGTLDEYFEAALLLHDEFRAHPLISTAFAPHFLPELDDQALTRLRVLIDQLERPLLVEVLLSRAEHEASLARHGASSLERLERLGLWHASTAALGFRHADPAAVLSAARSGVSVVDCPAMDLEASAVEDGASLRPGAGLAPTAELIAAGVPLALGSGQRGELEPLALLALAVRLAAVGRPNVALPSAEDWLRAATLGGARALGLEASVGSLAPGKWADLCCLDLRRLPIGPAPLEALFAGAGREAVSDVWVGGRALLKDGRHLTVDGEEIRARAAAACAQLAP